MGVFAGGGVGRVGCGGPWRVVKKNVWGAGGERTGGGWRRENRGRGGGWGGGGGYRV